MMDNREKIKRLQEEITLLKAGEELGRDAAHRLEQAGESDLPYDRPLLDEALLSNEKKRRVGTARKRVFGGRKRVLVAGAVLLLLCVCVLPVQALRYQIINFFMRNDTVYLHFYTAESEAELQAAGFRYLPELLPDGYAYESYEKDSQTRQAFYCNSAGNIMVFQQSNSNMCVAWDNENNYQAIAVNGRTAHMMQTDDYTAIFWEQDGYFFTVSGFLDTDTLVRTAESVKPL